ncbi:MATE efflux family protein [Lachnoanaerobaculum saburreum DSM 3986]|uniref:MATE efflux family protein n=2 Tax=Lachnoanaerobaculum saburreum TaxID=467210 RepID=E6LQS5_9FIRM|nr:MATE efflux family protein [Lachnoanaerobaculum saburreum DSM 3986]
MTGESFMIEKKLRGYILPNILATTGTSCYVLADTVFISMAEGANGITGLNLVLPVFAITYAIGAMIGIGSATKYTLLKSLGDKKTSDKYFSNSFIWSLLFGLPFLILGIFAPDAVLRILGADEVIEAVTHTYTRIILCFSPFFMLNFTFTAFVRNDNSPRIAMAATLISGIFNIIFDYVLMFPLGMGMAGAALATGISPVVSICICMVHYLSKKNNIRFCLTPPSFKRLLLSFSLGLVAFVGEISNGIITIVFNFILLSLVGNIAVAAYGVIANSALVGVAMLNGVSQGLQPVASETYGKGNKKDLKKIYLYSLSVSMIIAGILVALVTAFAPNIITAFNNENSDILADYAVTGIRVYFIGFIPAAFNIIMAGFYSATGRGRESSLIAISRGIAAIIVFALILPKIFGIMGVWSSFFAAEMFTAILCIILMRKTF